MHDKTLEEARAARRERARAAAAPQVAILEARSDAERERDRLQAELRFSGVCWKSGWQEPVELLLPQRREDGSWQHFACEPWSGITWRFFWKIGPRGGRYYRLEEAR